MKFWTDKVKRLTPYEPEAEIDEFTFIKLDTNENPHLVTRLLGRQLRQEHLESLRFYPSSASITVQHALFESFRKNGLDKQGIGVDNIFVGNSSDEILAHSYVAFFSGRENVLMPDISYSFYSGFGTLYDVGMVAVPVDSELKISIRNYYDANGVVLANPNSPTGWALPLNKIEQIVKNNPKGVVIVDEAYIDFAKVSSALELVSKYDNLLVVRTLSKSHSLAGLRVGYAVGNAGLIEGLRRVQNSFNPFPVGFLEQLVASYAIRDVEHVRENCEAIIGLREATAHEFRKMGYGLTRSEGNFLFVEIGRNASKLCKYLRFNRILVRHYENPRIRDYLRISIGTEEQMREVVKHVRWHNEA